MAKKKKTERQPAPVLTGHDERAESAVQTNAPLTGSPTRQTASPGTGADKPQTAASKFEAAVYYFSLFLPYILAMAD